MHYNSARFHLPKFFEKGVAEVPYQHHKILGGQHTPSQPLVAELLSLQGRT
jgi:hypothetical protein